MGFSVLALTFTSFGVASSATVSSGGFSVLSYNVDNPQIRSIAGSPLVAPPSNPGGDGGEVAPGTCDAEDNIANPNSFLREGSTGLGEIATPFDDSSSDRTNWIDEVQKAGGTITVGKPRVFSDVAYGSDLSGFREVEVTDFAIIKDSMPTPEVATTEEIKDKYGDYVTTTPGIVSVIDLGIMEDRIFQMGTMGGPLRFDSELRQELGVNADEDVLIYAHNLEYPIAVEYKDSSGKSCKSTSLTMKINYSTTVA